MSLCSIGNAFLRADVSQQGAELQSIFDLRHDVEYLWQGDPCFWPRRAPLLFPLVGRVRDGIYRYLDRVYSIESPHGFSKSLPFQVERHDSNAVRFVLEANQETLAQYPFLFRFAVEYALQGSSLQIFFDIENKNREDIMPFSLGFHPAFRIPLRDESFESYCLAFEEDEKPEQWTLEGVFMSGNRKPFPLKQNRFLPLCRPLFENEAIILDGIRKKSVSLLDAKGQVRWTMQFNDFRFLAFWQPPGSEAPFLCLEFWNGLPDFIDPEADSITQKPGILSLPPRNHYRASLRLDFS